MADKTKAELLEEADSLNAELGRLRAAQREVTPEAAALDKCIRALDALPKFGRYPFEPTTGGGTIKRILDYLASKYGVS